MIKKLLRFLLKKELKVIEILAEERGAANAAIDIVISGNDYSEERCGLTAGDEIVLTHKVSCCSKEHLLVDTVKIVSTRR